MGEKAQQNIISMHISVMLSVSVVGSEVNMPCSVGRMAF
jgi:hypothetical protein